MYYFKFKTNVNAKFFTVHQILYDFHLLFENIDEKALEKKWDDLHDQPLSCFKEKIETDKIPTLNIKVWQFITTYMSLKPRGNFWNALSSLIIFSPVRNTDSSL